MTTLKCRVCGGLFGCATDWGASYICESCNVPRESLRAKAAVGDECVFSPDQILALHKMIDDLTGFEGLMFCSQADDPNDFSPNKNMKEIEIKRRTLSGRIHYTNKKIAEVCHDDGILQAQRLGLIDAIIDDAETAAYELVTKEREIERLQGGIGYLLERSGHKPCTRLDLSEIAGRIMAGEDVYSYRLEAKKKA